MFLSGLSESGYLSNALITELMPASIPILVYKETISKVIKYESLETISFRNFHKRSSLFFTKCHACLQLALNESLYILIYCIYVLMYDYIYVLFVCRIRQYIHRHKRTGTGD